MFEPFITRHSIQYANGADGRARRLVFDKVFNYEKLDIYYTKLQKVTNSVVFLFATVEYWGDSGSIHLHISQTCTRPWFN